MATPRGIYEPPDSTKISQLAKAGRDIATTTDAAITAVIPEAEQAVVDAAGPAVEQALETSDVVHGADSRALRLAASETYAIPFTDTDGHVAGGVQGDGVFNFERPPRMAGQEDVTLRPVSAVLSGWAHPITDKDGYVAGGVRNDGTAEFFKLKLYPVTVLALMNDAIGYTRSSRTAVACIGDSLTNGYFGGSAGHTADAYPAKLQAVAPTGVTVYNVSTSGWCVDEVAARIGAIPLPLTVAGGTIPASGPVTVTTTAVIGWGTSTRSITGTLAGIPGTFTRTTAPALTFTRTDAGDATPVAGAPVFVPDQAGHAGETAVILLGRNNVSLNVKGSEPTVAAHIAAGVARIVEWLSADVKQVLIMSVTTTTGETSGTAGHNTVTAANALLAEKYGPRFLDLRRYLVDQAIHDLGITPTADDLAKMAGDTLPPSIMDPGDGTHWSKATAVLVAAQVNAYLTTREWI